MPRLLMPLMLRAFRLQSTSTLLSCMPPQGGCVCVCARAHATVCACTHWGSKFSFARAMCVLRGIGQCVALTWQVHTWEATHRVQRILGHHARVAGTPIPFHAWLHTRNAHAHICAGAQAVKIAPHTPVWGFALLFGDSPSCPGCPPNTAAHTLLP